MRFLADESCDYRVVTALRSKGHDVLAVVHVACGANDREVIALAVEQARVLLTEDGDFGRLVFAGDLGAGGGGVIFIRCPEDARPQLPAGIVAIVDELGEALTEGFAVWTPRRTRFRRFALHRNNT